MLLISPHPFTNSVIFSSSISYGRLPKKQVHVPPSGRGVFSRFVFEPSFFVLRSPVKPAVGEVNVGPLRTALNSQRIGASSGLWLRLVESAVKIR